MLCALLLGTLSGCFDYTEETRFDEKGAGKLSFVEDQPELSAVERMAAWTVKKNPFNDDDYFKKDLPAGVKVAEFRRETTNKRAILRVTYEFDDLNKLARWKADDKDDLLFRTLALTRAGDAWAFSRRIKAADKGQLENVQKHFTRSKILLKLTGPGQLTEHNAHRVENQNTCVWEGTLPELLEGKDGQGTELKAQYFIGTPAWVKALIGLAVLAVLAVAAFVLLRKKPAAPAAPAA
jgi:hypothetical protein